MKATISPRGVAIFISVASSGIVGLTLYLTTGIKGYNLLLILLISVLFVFIVVFILSSQLLNRFVLDRIIPIYKAIYNLNIPKKQLRRDLEDKDIIDVVNRDMLVWANSKSVEIDRLKEMEKYRKEFLGNVSHELKTPIFNIQGYILTLLDGGLEDKSINRKYLMQAEKSINRLISIIEDLETISRLEAGELKLDLTKFNIVQLVEEVFEAQEMRAKKRGIRFALDRLYEMPIWVYADKKRIYQVVNNLALNSIYYGKSGGRTSVSLTELPDAVKIDISDDGIGIEQKEIPRIFERFYRIDRSRSRDQGGTGLGLAIVKHIIEGHNQTVTVESSVNQGTTFSFHLNKPL